MNQFFHIVRLGAFYDIASAYNINFVKFLPGFRKRNQGCGVINIISAPACFKEKILI